MRPHKLLVFEGIDGSGKSTQCKLLTQYFVSNQLPVHTTFEPTQNFIGSQIRNILTGKQEGHPITVANLFAADRYDHLTHKDYGMLSILEKQHIICDRYLLSSYAYQSLDAPLEWIKEINKYNEALCWPDAIFFIKISPEIALQRIQANREQIDLFETEEQLNKIYQNYETAIASLQPKQRECVHIIDGNDTIENIQIKIQQIVARLI